jgi:hypothetical protein
VRPAQLFNHVEIDSTQKKRFSIQFSAVVLRYSRGVKFLALTPIHGESKDDQENRPAYLVKPGT